MTKQPPPGYLRDLLRVGPHNHAHLVAVRAAISVFVPLALLGLLGHHELSMFAAFGAFTALYGRTVDYPERAGMQIWAGGCLTVSVGLGVVVSGLEHRAVIVVLAGALLAAVVSPLSDGLGWHPPGPLFPLFAFSVCASAGQGLAQLPIALAVALGSVLFSLLVGQVGALAHRERFGAPVIRRPALLSGVAERGAVRHLFRYVLAVTLAGGVATLIGGTHPYWAMVAAVAAMGGPDLAARLIRGVHRVVGTLLGLVLAAALLSWYPQGFVLIVVIALLQLVTELLVGRNYALACVFITPLALAMGQLAEERPVGPLLIDRGWETALGAVIAMLILILIPSPRGPGRHRARGRWPLRRRRGGAPGGSVTLPS